MAQKQPQTVGMQMGVAGFQQNFIYKNGQPAALDPVGCTLPTLILNINTLVLHNASPLQVFTQLLDLSKVLFFKKKKPQILNF